MATIGNTYYNIADYALDDEYGVDLNGINKSLLMLFNNDIWAYNMLNGKFKGLWWRSWYFPEYKSNGYSLGDIVSYDGIPMVSFVADNWRTIQRMANSYLPNDDKLPDWDIDDMELVERYASVSNELIYLGDVAKHQQLSISLSDGNKEPPTNNDYWQPYIVTPTELDKKSGLLEKVFDVAVINHEKKYHSGIDKLDAADSNYENGLTDVSIYDSELDEYLPRIGLADDVWNDFMTSESGMKILGLGNISHEFLHIIKPLGDDTHRLETWVDTDGHIKVSGFIPVDLLEEVVPRSGTLEYNRWKVGGMRNFVMRLDYPINSNYSKMFYQKAEVGVDTDDIVGASGIRKFLPLVGIDKGKRSSEDNLSRILASLDNLVNGFLDDIDKMGTYGAATFPNSGDYWCFTEDMNVPDDEINGFVMESNYLNSKKVSIMLNVGKMNGFAGETRFLKSGENPLGNPEVLFTRVGGVDELPSEARLNELHLDLISDYTYVENGVPEREVIFGIIGNNTELIGKLFDINTRTADGSNVLNENIRNLESVTGKSNELNPDKTHNFKLGDLLSQCIPEVKFGTVIVEETTVELPGKMIRYNEADSTPDEVPDTSDVDMDNAGNLVIHGEIVDIDNPGGGGGGSTTKIAAGTITVTFKKYSMVLLNAELKEWPEKTSMDKEIENIDAEMEEMTESSKETASYSISMDNDGIAMVIYYPNRFLDGNGNPRYSELKDFAEAKPAGRELEEGDYDKILDFFEKSVDIQIRESGGGEVKIYIFRKKSYRAEPEGSVVHGGSEVPSSNPNPIKTLGDIDESVIASDMRLLRLFGITRSPSLMGVFSSRIDTLGVEVSPSVPNPSLGVGAWTFDSGQILTFTVPSGCTDILFDISGICQKYEIENRDFSFYDILDNDGNLEWVWDVVKFDEVADKLACIKQYRPDYDLSGVSGLLSDLKRMFGNLEKMFVDERFFVNYLKLRYIDIEPLREVVVPVLSAANITLLESEADLERCLDLISDSYSRYYTYLHLLILYGGFFAKYMNYVMKDRLGDEKSKYLRAAYLRFLKPVFVDSMVDYNSATKNLLPNLLQEVESSSLMGFEDCVEVFSNIHTKLNKLYSTVSNFVDILKDDDTDLSIISGDNMSNISEYREKFKSSGDKTCDLSEIEAYVKETEQLMSETKEVYDKLNEYRHNSKIGNSMYGIINIRMEYLRDFAKRFVHPNKSVCFGYKRYIEMQSNLWGFENTDTSSIRGKLDSLVAELELFGNLEGY